MLPVITGATGTISKSFRKFVSNIPGNAIRTWENKMILVQIWTDMLYNAMCPYEEEEEEQTPDHLIFQCKKLRNQKNEIKNKNNSGNWPTSNETLVNNYLQFFVTFVKSIDFTGLQ